MARPLAHWILPLALVASCASSSIDLAKATPQEVFAESLEQRYGKKRTAGVTAEGRERSRERAVEMQRRANAGQLESAEDHFFAAAVLVRSDALEHLELAESLGRRAAILGDARGRTVAAEAVDRQAVATGVPQRYGTQYVYDPLTRRWMLHPLDGRATDEDRRAAGLPPLSHFRQRVRELNDPESIEDTDERLRKAFR